MYEVHEQWLDCGSYRIKFVQETPGRKGSWSGPDSLSTHYNGNGLSSALNMPESIAFGSKSTHRPIDSSPTSTLSSQFGITGSSKSGPTIHTFHNEAGIGDQDGEPENLANDVSLLKYPLARLTIGASQVNHILGMSLPNEVGFTLELPISNGVPIQSKEAN
jgi:hypothetical protein